MECPAATSPRAKNWAKNGLSAAGRVWCVPLLPDHPCERHPRSTVEFPCTFSHNSRSRFCLKHATDDLGLSARLQARGEVGLATRPFLWPQCAGVQSAPEKRRGVGHFSERTELTEIAADVHQGTREDAQWYSFSANKANGLRRTNEDKQRAVKAALGHPKAAGLSDGKIAAHCGVGHNMVAEYRRTLLGVKSQPRTGADGRTIKHRQHRPQAPRRRSTAVRG